MPGQRPIHRFAGAATTAALVSLLFVSACGEEGSDAAGTDPGESSQPTGPGEGTAEAGVEIEDPAGAAIGDWDTGREDRPDQGAEAPRLTGVAVTEHDGYDRATFSFDGSAPQVIVSYVDELPAGDAEPPEMAGAHNLGVVLVGVDEESGFAPTEDLTDTVRELRDFGVFESELRVVLGLDTPGGGAPGFRVTSGEDEVVVDIAHEQAG